MTTPVTPKDTHRGPGARIFKGYGPLLALLVAFVFMAALVPTTDERDKSQVVALNGENNGLVGSSDGGAGSGDGSVTGAGDGAATGSGTGAGAGTGSAGTGTGAGPGAATNGTTKPGSGQPVGAKAGCPDRAKQVPGDPYSPPCVQFSGNNGGATSPGVTADTINVTYRVTNDPGFQQALANAAHANIADSPADVKRTVEALTEYFNKKFQLYGRHVNMIFFNGQGSATTEILGQGQEAAAVDAQAAKEKGAFADMTGGTPPYADALARNKIIAIGSPYMSREWNSQRAPYVWSELTDCSIITETASDYLAKRVLNKPAAFAGGGLANKPRKVAVLAPENTWYQECVKAGQDILAKQGKKYDEAIKYVLDLGSMSNQANNVIARLKNDGVTTIVCGCDPVFPVFLSQQASQQSYQPEWIVVGTALTDADIVGQLYDQGEWAHAFGISFAGATQPARNSLGYNAYKSVRQDEPAVAVDLIYQQMYLLWMGFQMAGPNLTPQTYQQGMFAYPGGTGPYGTWGFGPGHNTPTQDAREIYWSPKSTSIYNGAQGAYIETEPGKRYKIGAWPAGDPPVFKQ